MKRKYCLVLGMVVIGAVQAAACSSKFDSCADSRTCASSTGGEAGAPSSAGLAGSAGDDSDGMSGDAGAAGTSTGPTLFGECSVFGAVVCQSAASKQRLACDGKKWQAGTTCGEDERCDSRTGECAKTIAECANAKPGQTVCQGDSPLLCGPDLVSATPSDPCQGTCKEGACQAPICGDKKVEAGETCDDGDLTNSGACPKCKPAVCGDGSVYVGTEECDDGNTVAGDGCSPTCNWEAIAVAAGDEMTCALSAGGAVKCWGDGAQGALGQGNVLPLGDEPGEMGANLKPINLGTNRKAKAISAATNEACAILENGELKCWGNNSLGQLGTGDADDRGDTAGEMGDNLKAIALGNGRTAKQVSQAGFQTCAVLDNGNLKCWGSNVYGELGEGDTADHNSPGIIAPIRLGAMRTATFVSAGVGFANCALLDDGTGKCWGYTRMNALAAPSNANQGGAADAIGDWPDEVADLPPLNIIGHTLKSIGIGTAFVCALLDSGDVTCWGTSYEGEVGRDVNTIVGTTPAALAALGPIALGPKKVTSISVGAFHTCVILDGGQVKCWGLNARGQLGVGNTDSQGDSAGEMAALPIVPLARPAVQISAGRQHSCALLNDASVYCWGFNDKGQLGIGNAITVGDAPGFVLEPVDLAF